MAFNMHSDCPHHLETRPLSGYTIPRPSSQPHTQRDEKIRIGLSLHPDTHVHELDRVRSARELHERELSRLPRPSERNSIIDQYRIERHLRNLKDLDNQETRLLLMARIAWLSSETLRLKAKAAQARKDIERVRAERAQLFETARHVIRKRKREREVKYSDDAAIALSHDMIARVFGPKTLEQVKEEIEEQRLRYFPLQPEPLTTRGEADGRKRVKRMLDVLNKNKKEHGECAIEILERDEEGGVKVKRTYPAGMVRDVRWPILIKEPAAETRSGVQEDGVEDEKGAEPSMQ
jgi:hypothetical protein